jgi:dGTP triphosphohydrolase
MSELKKSTRYLLVTYHKRAGFKPFYRRGGQRFDHNAQRLVDVTTLEPGAAEAILADAALAVRQLTEKGAEKFERLLNEQEEKSQTPNDEETAALNDALAKARKALKDERARCEDLERQNTKLVEALDMGEQLNAQLEARLAAFTAAETLDDDSTPEE